jgi:carotenoid 1,2-hydratase
VQCKSGAQRLVLQRFRPDGQSETFEAPARHRLAQTAWGIARSTRGDPNHRAQVLKVFENTPFYVRDLVRTSLDGEVIDAVHESLDARRLASWPVRMMLPFRMPRLA